MVGDQKTRNGYGCAAHPLDGRAAGGLVGQGLMSSSPPSAYI